MRSRGVLLDVGYTLMDESARLRAGLAWLSARLRDFGVDEPPDSLVRRYAAACAAPRQPSLLVQAAEDAGADPATARALRLEIPWDAVPLLAYPDARSALEAMRAAGLRTGVLANQPPSAAEDLARAGLAPLLDDVWLSDAVGLSKPDPGFFLLALERWSLPPERVAYVGDRPDNDVRPARALGLATVRVRLGPHAAQEPRGPDEEPDADVPDLSAAARWLAAWARS